MLRSTFLVAFFVCICCISSIRTDSPCKTPNDKDGECINIRSCKSLIEILKKPTKSDEDKNFLRNSKCGGDATNKNVKVCCPKSTMSPTNFATDTSLIPNENICGLNTQDKLIGGNITSLDEFPWAALLQYKDRNTNQKEFMCGGVLISKRYVLTAAHCAGSNIEGMDLVSVRLGEWNVSSAPDCVEMYSDNELICNEMHEDVKVEQSIPHPNYSAQDRSQQHDIALIRLVKDVIYTDTIRPICLIGGKLGTNYRTSEFENQRHDVVGWGKTETSFRSSVKLKIKIPIVSRSICDRQYNRANVKITKNQICAGGETKTDSCSGDSGGPMMRLFNEDYGSRWFLTGIVSFGLKECGVKEWPGVYTRVTNYYDWIKTVVKA